MAKGTTLRGSEWVDDLQSWYDPDDDELVRLAHDRAKRRGGDDEPPRFLPPQPLREDEVICRSCRLAVRRRIPDGVPLLVCDDCRW
ncbi:MAG: hypothetical protein GEU81_14525 [Nitriliruptorales bacterium]|nr:hypothetical protein [Nitriliruptorales bacterium]